jgi:metal-responsive CopG/Arc/MetJ family transcriptional regulator
MRNVAVHVTIPTHLLREIDKLAGKRGRSAFFREAAENAFRIRGSNGSLAEDIRDLVTARTNLASKTRIPWSSVKVSAKKSVRKQLKAG